jgi:hypothetical protein
MIVPWFSCLQTQEYFLCPLSYSPHLLHDESCSPAWYVSLLLNEFAICISTMEPRFEEECRMLCGLMRGG